jgi:hypothetical protein
MILEPEVPRVQGGPGRRPPSERPVEALEADSDRNLQVRFPNEFLILNGWRLQCHDAPSRANPAKHWQRGYPHEPPGPWSRRDHITLARRARAISESKVFITCFLARCALTTGARRSSCSSAGKSPSCLSSLHLGPTRRRTRSRIPGQQGPGPSHPPGRPAQQAVTCTTGTSGILTRTVTTWTG